MQIDMHYYGVYTLARAAGVNREAAEVIATVAQFVDDNGKSSESNLFDDLSRFYYKATGHHAHDVKENLDEEDQRHVWVPFHFIPGNEGDSFAQRLICRKDSKIANEMKEYNISSSDRPYYLELVGITAHVYADTFAHYGFSGISHPLNMIAEGSLEHLNFKNDEIEAHVLGKAASFFKKYNISLPNISAMVIQHGQSMVKFGSLGHGAVLTNPDRPYLTWRYGTEFPSRETVDRENTEDFMQGCERLHDMFRSFLDARPEHAEGSGKDFGAISDRVRDVLEVQADKDGRIGAWRETAQSGDLFSGGGEIIPDYDVENWLTRRDSMSGDDSSKIPDEPIYRFYQAAQAHRSYVLRDLLPRHGLVVA